MHTGLVPSARVRMRTDSMRPTMSASVGCPVNTHAAYQRSGTACSVTAASLGAGALLASCGQSKSWFVAAVACRYPGNNCTEGKRLHCPLEKHDVTPLKHFNNNCTALPGTIPACCP